MRRTLTLRRETLTELTNDELTEVVAGTAATVVCQLVDKISVKLDCHSWKCTL